MCHLIIAKKMKDAAAKTKQDFFSDNCLFVTISHGNVGYLLQDPRGWGGSGVRGGGGVPTRA